MASPLVGAVVVEDTGEWAVEIENSPVGVQQRRDVFAGLRPGLEHRGAERSGACSLTLFLPAAQQAGRVGQRGLVDHGVTVRAQQEDVFWLRPILRGEVWVLVRARTFGAGGDDVGELADVHAVALDENMQVNPALRILAVPARLRPQPVLSRLGQLEALGRSGGHLTGLRAARR